VARPPVDHRRLVATPLFDHRLIARRQAHALTGGEHMVGQVAAAGNPHTAFEYREFTVERVEPDRPTLGDTLRAAGYEMRIHHESPVATRPCER